MSRPQLTERKVLGIHVGIALLVLVLDQLTKAFILTILKPFTSYPVTEFLNFILVYNKGAAFGFLSNSTFDANKLFLFLNIGILVLLFGVLWTLRPGRSQSATGIWLIIGGALGNLVDRIVHGHVVDFIDFHYAGWHYSTFNLADACITVGAVLIALELFNLRLLFRRS